MSAALSWSGRSLSELLGAVAIVVALLTLVGLLRRAVHRPRAATGDPLLAAELDRLRAPHTRSLAAVVIDLQVPGLGVRSAYVDCGPDSAFEIGSIGKAVTGLLVADAVDRGEISLDAPLETWLPELSSSAIGARGLRDLGTHTSGLPNLPWTPSGGLGLLLFAAFGVDPYRGQDRGYVLRHAARASPRPGYAYSNLGGALAGHVVAAAAGLDYQALVAERIFGPLGMSGTTAYASARIRRGWRRHGRRAQPWRPGGFVPAGDIVSTPADLTRLAQALLDGTAPGAWAMRSLDDAHGLFWVVQRAPGSGRTMAWHNGQTGGYAGHLVIYPEARRAVIVLANVADATDLARVAHELTRWVVSRPEHPSG